jgi:hypothetical protein
VLIPSAITSQWVWCIQSKWVTQCHLVRVGVLVKYALETFRLRENSPLSAIEPHFTLSTTLSLYIPLYDL